MKYKTYIRTDGGSTIGLGHLVRCIALAQMLKENFDIHFICKEVPDNIEAEIHKCGFLLNKIQEEESFFELLSGREFVILDHYGLGSDYQQIIKKNGSKLICIDDLHDRQFFADLIINHAPGVEVGNYHAQPYTRIALGLEYALLRPSFLEAAKHSRNIGQIETVLICFGGSDPNNLTQSTLETVMKLNQFHKIIVITGTAYNFQEHLETFNNFSKVVEYHHAIGEQQMAKLMLKADVAIVPASGIMLEALSTGCIIVSGMYMDNQKFLFSAFKDLNILISAADFSTKNLKIALGSVRKMKSKLIDGLSGKRILKKFILLLNEQYCTIRIATKNDLQQTFQWASNPKIRAFAFSQNKIGIEEHENWFLNRITANNCYYLIFEVENQSAGSIRFDKIDNQAIISYLLDPEFHGKGLSSVLIKMGIEWLCNKKDKSIKEIIGDVLKCNVASIKAFENLNFSSETVNSKTLRFKKAINENRE